METQQQVTARKARRSAHGQEPLREKIVRYFRRAGTDVVYALELRNAFGHSGLDEASRMARLGMLEKVRTGVYRAKDLPR